MKTVVKYILYKYIYIQYFSLIFSSILVPSGPPLNVNINSRSNNSLGISWNAPDKNLWNGKLTGYQVCYSSSVIGENQECFHTESSVLSYNIPQLQPSTRYFVTVAASTKIGYGNKSSEISKITNGGKRQQYMHLLYSTRMRRTE